MISNLFSNRHFTLTAQILSQQSRMPSHYLTRTSVLLICFIVTAIITESTSIFRLNGLVVFGSVSGFNLVIVSLIALKFFGSLIVSEKEQGTLGLIMIAPLHPISVISAKTIPIFFSLSTLVIVQLPLVIIAVTLGSIILDQILLFYVICLFHLLMMAGICLPLSTVAKRTGDAIGLALLCMFFFSLLPTLLMIIRQFLWNPPFMGQMIETVTAVQSWYIWGIILANKYNALQIIIYISSCSVIFAGGLFLSLKLIKHIDLSDPTATKNKSAGGRRTKENRAWSNANTWKDFNFFAGGRKKLILKMIALSGLLLYLPWQFKDQGTEFMSEEYLKMMIAIGSPLITIIFLLDFLVNLNGFIQKEVKGKTLSNVLLQPISLNEFFLMKLRAAFFSSLGTFCLMVILNLLNIKGVIYFISNLGAPGIIGLIFGTSFFFAVCMVNAIGYRKERTLMQQIATAVLVFIGIVLGSSAIAIAAEISRGYPLIFSILLSIIFIIGIWIAFNTAKTYLQRMLETEN